MKTYSISVKREYLDKSVCLAEAGRILREGHIECMTEGQLAKEIFFHTLVYYACDRYGMLPGLKEHADPIDLEDRGDRLHRRIAFAASWAIPVRLLRRMRRHR